MLSTIRRTGSAAAQTASDVVRRFTQGGLMSVWCTAVLALGVLGLVHGFFADSHTLSGGMMIAGDETEPWDDAMEYLLWLIGLLV